MRITPARARIIREALENWSNFKVLPKHHAARSALSSFGEESNILGRFLKQIRKVNRPSLTDRDVMRLGSDLSSEISQPMRRLRELVSAKRKSLENIPASPKSDYRKLLDTDSKSFVNSHD